MVNEFEGVWILATFGFVQQRFKLYSYGRYEFIKWIGE